MSTRWRRIAKASPVVSTRGAKASQRALGIAGYPSEQDFTNMVSSNMIVNCPVTPNYIKNANNIFGPDVPSMKGKSVRRRTEDLFSNYVNITKEILSMNADLEVSGNVIFINKMSLLVSVSKRLKFATIEYIPNRLEKDLDRSVNKIIDVYKNEAYQSILCIWTLSLTF